MKSIAIVALTLAAGGPVAAEQKSFSAKDVRTLIVQTQAGDIEVAAGGDEILVELTRPDVKRCEVEMTSQGGTVVLRAEGRERGWFGGETCRAGFRIRVPAALAVEVESVSGRLKLSGTAALVRARSVSGDLRLEGLRGEADVESISGDIRLSWATAPKAGDVRVKTISGNVRLGLPAGASARAELSSLSGETTNQLGDQGDSRLELSASSISGDIRVERL